MFSPVGYQKVFAKYFNTDDVKLTKLCNDHKGLASQVTVHSHCLPTALQGCPILNVLNNVTSAFVCLLCFPSIIISNHLLDVWQFALQLLAIIPLTFVIRRLKRKENEPGKLKKKNELHVCYWEGRAEQQRGKLITQNCWEC